MRKIFFVFSFTAATMMFGQDQTERKSGPPEGKAFAGESYGANVALQSGQNSLSTARLSEKLKKQAKLSNVAVRGKVTEVCEKKGCWLTVEGPANEKFFVKMKDYAFFVPTALVGKIILLEGDAELKTVSVNEQKHYAEDAKKSQAEIDAITAPKKEIRFMATGIRVLK